jgi:hypothetical protein
LKNKIQSNQKFLEQAFYEIDTLTEEFISLKAEILNKNEVNLCLEKKNANLRQQIDELSDELFCLNGNIQAKDNELNLQVSNFSIFVFQNQWQFNFSFKISIISHLNSTIKFIEKDLDLSYEKNNHIINENQR